MLWKSLRELLRGSTLRWFSSAEHWSDDRPLFLEHEVRLLPVQTEHHAHAADTQLPAAEGAAVDVQLQPDHEEMPNLLAPVAHFMLLSETLVHLDHKKVNVTWQSFLITNYI